MPSTTSSPSSTIPRGENFVHQAASALTFCCLIGALFFAPPIKSVGVIYTIAQNPDAGGVARQTQHYLYLHLPPFFMPFHLAPGPFPLSPQSSIWTRLPSVKPMDATAGSDPHRATPAPLQPKRLRSIPMLPERAALLDAITPSEYPPFSILSLLILFPPQPRRFAAPKAASRAAADVLSAASFSWTHRCAPTTLWPAPRQRPPRRHPPPPPPN